MTATSARWNWAGLALTGLLFYLVFLVVTMPATWASEFLRRTSHGLITVEHPAGSIWSGSGMLVVGPKGTTQYRQPIGWDVQPLWLIAGRVRADLQSQDKTVLQAQATLSYRRVVLERLQADVPASIVSSLYSPAALISPTGTLHIETERLELEPGRAGGEARISWLGAGGRFGGIGEIGDYLLQISGQGDKVSLRSQTLRGDVRIEAQGEWLIANNGGLQLSGTISTGIQNAGTASLLALLNAHPDGGQHRFNYTTRLPWPWGP